METGKNQEIDPQSLSLDDDKDNSSSLTNVYSTYVPSIFSGKTYSQLQSLAEKSLYMAHSNTIMQNNIRLMRVLI